MILNKTAVLTPSVSPLEEIIISCFHPDSIVGTNRVDGASEADIKTKLGKARSAFDQLNTIWKDRKISMTTKTLVLNSNVKTVLLCVSEIWHVTETCNKTLQILKFI